MSVESHDVAVREVLSLDVEYLGLLPIPSTLRCWMRLGDELRDLWLTCDRSAASALELAGELVLSPREYLLIARLMAAEMLGRITVQRALERKAQCRDHRVDAEALGWRGPLPQKQPWTFEQLLDLVGAELVEVHLEGDEASGGRS